MTGLIYDFATQFFQKEKGFNKDLEVSASPTPKESQKAIPSLNPEIKRNKVPDIKEMKR